MGIIDSPPCLSADTEYPSIESLKNITVYARTLPPVPKNCPTPMGVAGKEIVMLKATELDARSYISSIKVMRVGCTVNNGRPAKPPEFSGELPILRVFEAFLPKSRLWEDVARNF